MNNRKKDISGITFGRLTVLNEDHVDKFHRVMWKCKCSCGNECVVAGTNLRSDGTRSCGCLNKEQIRNLSASRKENIVGNKFGRLTVLRQSIVVKNQQKWVCRCECGNETVVSTNSLKCGNTKSCGCYSRDIRKNIKPNLTHGLSRDKYGKKPRLFRIWAGMRNRCLNKRDKKYPDYGGRGILICFDWMKFENFHEWAIANGYMDDLTIERVNNDGNYSPENCTWITRGAQSLNRRNSIKNRINKQH